MSYALEYLEVSQPLQVDKHIVPFNDFCCPMPLVLIGVMMASGANSKDAKEAVVRFGLHFLKTSAPLRIDIRLLKFFTSPFSSS